jgi:phosphoribosylanthranilate isomerase
MVKDKEFQIKICGLSTPESIDAAIAGGATMLGFIFFEKSPRHLTLEQASELSKHINGRVKLVVVTVNADDAYLDAIVKAAKPDVLQLHGSESLDRVQAVKSRYNLPILKAFAIKSEADFNNLADYAPHIEAYLFDAKAPEGAELPGGNGITFDWELLKKLDINSPWILSGGLHADNVVAGIEMLQGLENFAGLDISSGVEKAAGIKDNDKIEKFLMAAHKAINISG